MWWEAGGPRGERVAGKNEGADQKLRGWWDARLGSSCVTALHKGLRRQRGSGSEVISEPPACALRARDVDYSNNEHPSIPPRFTEQTRLGRPVVDFFFSVFIM